MADDLPTRAENDVRKLGNYVRLAERLAQRLEIADLRTLSDEDLDFLKAWCERAGTITNLALDCKTVFDERREEAARG